DILDLAKIESGTVSVDFASMAVGDLEDYVDRTFRPVAESKGLGFRVDIDPRMPETLQTDSKRLQQLLRNLLSNAIKFTERGAVTLRAQLWPPGRVAATLRQEAPMAAPRPAVDHSLAPQDEVRDDRHDIRPDDRVLLIVDDDLAFAQVLVDVAHRRGFKAVVASRGMSGIALVRELRPHAITLDLKLPDISGWRLLRQLKKDLSIRHIPVHVISVED